MEGAREDLVAFPHGRCSNTEQDESEIKVGILALIADTIIDCHELAGQSTS
jgi:hypothetical protein